MNVSVAIVTYNRSDVIGKCLDSLKKQGRKPFETIIVDSSPDKKTKSVVKKFRNVKYFHSQKKLYQPQARNIALKKAKGDIIAFIDDDCIASKYWLENIEKGYTYENTVAVGGPCILSDINLNPKLPIISNKKNQNRFNIAGDIVNNSRRWIPKNPIKTQVLMGGNMSFLVKTLRKIKGFDEFYSRNAAFREETDPQIALQKLGYSMIYMPAALVYNLDWKTGGIKDDNKDYFYWCGVNQRYFVDKYFHKFLSRLSWITFSRNPPSLPIGLVLALIRRDTNILQWYRGLFGF